MGINAITAGQINLLISSRKIPVRQEQAVTEEWIAQEGAVIATAHQISIERKIALLPYIIDGEIPCVRGATERTLTQQRRKSADRHSRKCRSTAEGLRSGWRAEESIVGECPLHHRVEIGVRRACGQSMPKMGFDFRFRPECANVTGIDSRAKAGMCGD